MTEPNTGCARNQGTTQFCAEAVEVHKELREARAQIEWLKSDLYHAIQALHCSAPNELMSVEEIQAWLEIRNTLSDKYTECIP